MQTKYNISYFWSLFVYFQKTKAVKNPFHNIIHSTENGYYVEEEFYEDVKCLEKLALSMGFKHDDIILFDDLTKHETLQALVYGMELKYTL